MHSNKYQKWYDALILRGRLRNRPNGYTERHHIIPRCFGGPDSPDNIVRLTGREHYVAHLLLYQMSTGLRRQQMLRALIRFARKTSRQFSLAREIVANAYRGEGNPAYGKRWVHNPHSGDIQFTDQVPEGYLLGLPMQRGGHRGYQWITDGSTETMWPRNVAMPDGWSEGRSLRPSRDQLRSASAKRHTAEADKAHGEKLRGRVRLFDPRTGTVRTIQKDEAASLLHDGWERGGLTPNSRGCCIEGRRFVTLAAAARYHGISSMTVAYRIRTGRDGWSFG